MTSSQQYHYPFLLKAVLGNFPARYCHQLGSSVALSGDRVIEKLNVTWHHLILINLDSNDVSEDYLVTNIRKIEPDIPLIGLGNHDRSSGEGITCLKKPLTFKRIKDVFPQATTAKEIKAGRRALKGLILSIL